MRQNRETIALLYHATGTGKTVTAVMDAKRCGGRVLFVAHTMELVSQAYKIIPDLVVDLSGTRKFRYFRKERAQEYSDRFGWTILTDDNRYELFIEMVEKMLMDHSYKPVFLKGVLKHVDSKGRVRIDDLVEFFKSFYNERRERGLVVEKKNSLFAREGYSDKEVEYSILSNPFRRFETIKRSA